MKFGFIIDPIEKLDPTHDTSVAFMEAAQEMGHEVWTTTANDLEVVGGVARSLWYPVRLTPVTLGENHWIAIEKWFDRQDATLLPLEDLDAIFMRTDPPVDLFYLYATYCLDNVDPAKTLVVNAPKGLRAANEKMYALQFQSVIPETIVTANKVTIRKFVEKKGRAVLKPLGGKAGEGILVLHPDDGNFYSMVEISTLRGKLPVMVQQFLPEAKQGDKRVILLDGEPIGAINRVPAKGEFRGNMAVGGSVEKVEVTDRDREICRQLAPTLARDGLYFVGLDIIGGYLTEVNVTSPTGVREADRLNNTRLGETVIQWAVDRISLQSGS